MFKHVKQEAGWEFGKVCKFTVEVIISEVGL